MALERDVYEESACHAATWEMEVAHAGGTRCELGRPETIFSGSSGIIFLALCRGKQGQ